MSENDPTPEEVQRVRAYEKRKRDEDWRKNMAEREAKVAARVERVKGLLVGKVVAGVEISGMNEYGEIRGTDSELKLFFEGGRTLTVDIGGWEETYLDVTINDV